MNESVASRKNAVREAAGETDRALMARAHEDDAVAALALLDRYAGPLFNLALRATGNPSVAEEAVCAVLAPALRELSERVPRGERRWIVELSRRLYRWLLDRGLRPDDRTARVRIGSRHWETERLGVAPTARPSPRRYAQRLRQRLQRAWSALTMRERFVLALSETTRASPAELGEVLGLSEGAARAVRDEAKLSLVARLPADRRSARGRRTRDG